MSDIHALSGAYAVDALDDDERTEFEQHLAVCAECRAEVASFRETAALIAETQAETPPPSRCATGVLAGITPGPAAAPETHRTPADDAAHRGHGSTVAAPAPARAVPAAGRARRPSSCWPSGVLVWQPWSSPTTHQPGRPDHGTRPTPSASPSRCRAAASSPSSAPPP